MLAVKASASAVPCALLIIITLTPPWRPNLVPVSAATSEPLLLLVLAVSRRRRSACLLLPLTGAALMALPLPIIAAFDANAGTKAAARQAAVDSAAIVATAPLDNMRKQFLSRCDKTSGGRVDSSSRLGGINWYSVPQLHLLEKLKACSTTHERETCLINTP